MNPYKIEDGLAFVFLQKREKDRKTLPGYFAFFGGGIEEGESSEQALKREIKEELEFDLKDHKFLKRYIFDWIANVYYIKVEEDFESKVKVNEGEYGKFFSEKGIEVEPMIIEGDRIVLKEFYDLLRRNEEI